MIPVQVIRVYLVRALVDRGYGEIGPIEYEAYRTKEVADRRVDFLTAQPLSEMERVFKRVIVGPELAYAIDDNGKLHLIRHMTDRVNLKGEEDVND